MYCKNCGFKYEYNSKYCPNCGNELVISTSKQNLKTELEPTRDPFAKNYKKIFNICFYPVIGCLALLILISSFGSLAYFFGTIMDIFFNIWIWLFIIFIFIFRKKHKVWSLVIGIIFGVFTILAAIYSLINSVWVQVLR